MLICLDLFCGAGGASKGYRRAGFKVYGVDHNKNMLKAYPYAHVLADCFDVMKRLTRGEKIRFNDGTVLGLEDIDLIHASPPCQGYIDYASDVIHPRWIKRTRRALRLAGKPYIIENVDRAPLEEAILLCGTMLDIEVIRHRLFETWPRLNSEFSKLKLECNHVGTVSDGNYAGMYGHGRPNGRRNGELVARDRGFIPDGYSLTDWWRECSGNTWMKTRRQLSESIPWSYTYLLGGLMYKCLEKKNASYAQISLVTQES